MTAVRRNILTDANARNQFLNGIAALDQEMRGITAGDVYAYLQRNSIPVQFRGINQQLSTYDLFVLWHVIAMSITMPPGNAAHSGPVFLPWHRMYLLRLEQELQRISNNLDAGLPYWDWAADGELAPDAQWQADLWSDANIGPSRGSVSRGRVSTLRVRLWQDTRTGILYSINPRQINRQAGMDNRNQRLPNRDWVQYAVSQNQYDVAPWNQSTTSHRNVLEGWLFGPQLHNLVHVWIGGDMGPGTSPNDPAFFLNHCNVDRIWEAWMSNRGRSYRPAQNEGTVGHRLNDLMVALFGEAMTPAQVLDPATWYSYDSLAVG